MPSPPRGFSEMSCMVMITTRGSEATLLRPTSTLNAFREAGTFPLEDYDLAS